MRYLPVIIFSIWLQNSAGQGARVPVASKRPAGNGGNITVSITGPGSLSSSEGNSTSRNITVISNPVSPEPNTVQQDSTPAQSSFTSSPSNSTQSAVTATNPSSNGTEPSAAGNRTTVVTTTLPTSISPVVASPAVNFPRFNAPVARKGFNRNYGRMEGRVFPLKNDSGSPPPQSPGVWEALKSLIMNGHGQTLRSDEEAIILQTAVPGVDYPAYAEIPDTRFSCDAVNQAGFYADPDAGCQVFRRCDLDGNLWSFLCPNQTLFNQITLICDWFFHVDCSKSRSFYDYSNARLYHEMWHLLEDPIVS